ncbi:MAG: hypothetical protein RL885_31395 [Planctomycetota bacterium]
MRSLSPDMLRRRAAALMRIAAALLIVFLASDAVAQTEPESFLEPGSHDVGFRCSWALDETRTYRTAFDDGETYGASKAPRPILVNCWYPTEAEADAPLMSHAEYFEIEPANEALHALASELTSLARGIAAEEITGKPEAELTPEEAVSLDHILSSPTRARRSATPLEGPFPIVVHHSGAASSYEDNAAFCEILASHGFVVVSSAFCKGDGSSLHIDGRIDSGLDLAFLATWAASEAHGDWQRIAYVGHSAGAQAILRDALRSSSPADVRVLLDTTLDYYALRTPGWRELTDRVLERAEAVTGPMLVTAGPAASFELIDHLTGCERTYLTIPDLDHNEYIAQGHQHNRWLMMAQPGDGDLPRATAAHRDYAALVAFVVSYLKAHLLGEPGPLAEASLAAKRSRLGDAIHLEVARLGEDGPEPIDPTTAPTPRQLPHLLREQGVERTCEILLRTKDSKSLVHESSMLLASTIFSLMEDGRREEAKQLYETVRTFRPQVIGTITFLAFMSELTGRLDDAKRLLEAAVFLDPENREAQAKLEKLNRIKDD